MTVQQIKAKIAALVEERRGYVMRGLDDRAAQVDEELRRLGALGGPPLRSHRRKKPGS